MSRRRASLFASLFLVLGLASTTICSAAPRPVPATKESIAAYASVLRQFNPEMPDWQSKDLARHLLITAKKERIDTNMLAAIVTVESSWRTTAVSYAGAIGLGQLMPGTAATLGVNPHDPVQNLQGAARYLRGLLQQFGSQRNRYALVFAAYNAGPKAVKEYGGIPPYAETQHYVVKVLSAWNALRHMVHIPTSVFVAADHSSAPLPTGADVDYWLKGDAGK
jgi:soluble lytic murein transglycosylase-like protein